MTSNQIAYWNLRETQRANLAREKENNRTNLQNEKIKARSNDITLLLGQGNLAESVRSNQAREKENYRTNTVKELETGRHNLATEYIDYSKIPFLAEQSKASIMQGQAALTNAATRANELVETNRSNLKNEELKQQQLDETHRTNIRYENLKAFQDAAQSAATIQNAKTNQGVLSENTRHNQSSEDISRRNMLYSNYLRSLELGQRNEADGFRNLNTSLGNLSKVSGGIK